MEIIVTSLSLRVSFILFVSIGLWSSIASAEENFKTFITEKDNYQCRYQVHRGIEPLSFDMKYNPNMVKVTNKNFSRDFYKSSEQFTVYWLVYTISPVDNEDCHGEIHPGIDPWIESYAQDLLNNSSLNQKSLDSEIDIIFEEVPTEEYLLVQEKLKFGVSYPLVVRRGQELLQCGAIAFRDGKLGKTLDYVVKLWKAEDGKCFQPGRLRQEIVESNTCMNFNNLMTLSESEIHGNYSTPDDLISTPKHSKLGNGYRSISLADDVNHRNIVHTRCDGENYLTTPKAMPLNSGSEEILQLELLAFSEADFPYIDGNSYETLLMNFNNDLSYLVIVGAQ